MVSRSMRVLIITKVVFRGCLLCPFGMYLCHKFKRSTMKFIGFLLALLIILTGFSMLLFLGLFVGYWLTLVGLERVAPKFVYKWIGHEE